MSEFNRRDLEALGYRDVSVVPAGLAPSRLKRTRPDAALADDLRSRYPQGFVLTVSQVLPHKRVELLVQAMHLVQWVHERGIGLVVVGHQRLQSYARALHQAARELNVRDVWFTGGVPDAAVATLYRATAVYATASAHEGLALPPLEAMSFGVPVVAIGTGAIPETLGGAGLVLPADAGPVLLAEALVEVLSNGELRDGLVTAGGTGRAGRVGAAGRPCVALLRDRLGT